MNKHLIHDVVWSVFWAIITVTLMCVFLKFFHDAIFIFDFGGF